MRAIDDNDLYRVKLGRYKPIGLNSSKNLLRKNTIIIVRKTEKFNNQQGLTHLQRHHTHIDKNVCFFRKLHCSLFVMGWIGKDDMNASMSIHTVHYLPILLPQINYELGTIQPAGQHEANLRVHGISSRALTCDVTKLPLQTVAQLTRSATSASWGDKTHSGVGSSTDESQWRFTLITRRQNQVKAL